MTACGMGRRGGAVVPRVYKCYDCYAILTDPKQVIVVHCGDADTRYVNVGGVVPTASMCLRCATLKHRGTESVVYSEAWRYDQLRLVTDLDAEDAVEKDAFGRKTFDDPQWMEEDDIY